MTTKTVAADEEVGAAGDAEDAAGKQTRAQKKMMKAMSKLNLKHVPGIMKVVMRRKGNILFSIHGGEVYKVRISYLSKWSNKMHWTSHIDTHELALWPEFLKSSSF